MSSFFTNVIKLISGSAIAQIVGILLIPIITRIYSPENFGVFQLFLSISSIIVIFACLSYQLAIMLPKEDIDSANIVVLCMILITITSIISGILFFIFSTPIVNLLKVPELSQYLVFLPFVIFLSGFFSVMTYWTSRKKQFGFMAIAQVTNAISSRGIQIGAGLLAPVSSIGLIAGLIFGYIAYIVVLLIQVLKKDLRIFKTVTLNGITNLAKRYKRFPMFTSWSTLANTLSTQLTPMILVFFFSPLIVGYYAIANTAVFLPMGLIGMATSQVFFQKASEEKNRTGSIKHIVEGIQKRLISIGMFPMFLLLIIGTDLFTFVLGSQWYIAGEYAGILAPWILLVFIASPLSTIFSILEKQTASLSFNLILLISRISVLIIGGLYGNPFVALLLFSLTGVIFWGWMNLYLLNISGVSYMVGLKQYIRFFCFGLVVSIPLIAAKLFLVNTYLLFLIAGIAFVIYYAIVISQDPLLKNELNRILRGTNQ